MYGIMWNPWSQEVYSLNVKRARLCHMRWKAFCAFNDNDKSFLKRKIPRGLSLKYNREEMRQLTYDTIL